MSWLHWSWKYIGCTALHGVACIAHGYTHCIALHGVGCIALSGEGCSIACIALNGEGCIAHGIACSALETSRAVLPMGTCLAVMPECRAKSPWGRCMRLVSSQGSSDSS